MNNRYEILNAGGEVVNTILASEAFVSANYSHWRVVETPQTVPQSVTQRQARLMLHRQGVLAGVDAVIDSMPEPAKTEARIEWEYASAIMRSSPLVAAMGVALGLNDAGLDALFVAAAAL